MQLSEVTLFQRLSSTEIWNRDLLFSAAITDGVLSFTMDCLRLNNYSPYWLLVDLIGFVATAVMAYLFRFTSKKFGKSSYKTPIPNFAVAIVLGALHNLLIAQLAIGFGLEQQLRPIFRIIGGALTLVPLIWVTTGVLAARINHQIRLSQLVATRQKLDNYRRNLRPKLAQEAQKLAGQARSLIVPQLEQIRQQLTGAAGYQTALDALETLVIRDLRPMNADLASREQLLQSRLQDPPLEATPIAKLPKYVALSSAVNPLVMALWGVAQQSLSLYFFVGWVSLLWGLATGAVNWVILALVKRLIPKSVVISTTIAMALSALLGLVAALPTAFADALAMGSFARSLPVVVPAFAVAMVLAGYICYVVAATNDQKRIELDLDNKNKELEQQISLFDQKIWIARRRWLAVLHGTVQSSITAAITRIKAMPAQDMSNRLAILQDLERATLALETPEIQSLNLVAAFRDLQQTWAGICQIEALPDSDAQDLVLTNEDAKTCVNELIKEAVGNAIRHGRASKVSIQLQIARPQVLRLTVENNGAAPSANSVPGVGSQLFDDLSIEWSRVYNHRTQLTSVTALVALP